MSLQKLAPRERRLADYAERIAYQWHVGEVGFDGRPYAATVLKLGVRIALEFSIGDGDLVATLWLRHGLRSAPDGVEVDRRLKTIRGTFGDHVHDMVWAVTAPSTYDYQTIAAKVERFPGAAPVWAISVLVSLIGCYSGCNDHIARRYALEHSDMVRVVKPHIPEQLWTLLEQSYPKDMITRIPISIARLSRRQVPTLRLV